MKIDHGTALEGRTLVAEELLRRRVGGEDAAVGRVGHEDTGGRVVDGAAVAGLLLEEQILPSLDEEVGDVQDADRELLLEEPAEGPGPGRVVGVLAHQVVGQELDEVHL